MCKSIRHVYYCEELFIVKHKSRHSCASAIFYDLGHKTISHNCQFDFVFNQTVPPVILNGGKRLLLANFHGPRSLKCNLENGGLATPAPSHTYAVVNREFLCDCHLDLEHASLLRQLSACGQNRTAHLSLKFFVNMGFYQLLHSVKPKLLQNVNPKIHSRQQTIPLRLSKGIIKPLDKATDLRDIIDRIAENKYPDPSPPNITKLLPKAYSYLISVVTACLALGLGICLLLLALKHHKLKTLVSGLALNVLPIVEARNQEKVICSNPQLTALATVFTVAGVLFW